MIHQDAVRFQRRWARVAGLMLCLVLVVDLTGMQLGSPILGRSLFLLGSFFTVPLAFGLYFALRPVYTALAGVALGCRLLEAALGIVAAVAGFPAVSARLAAVPSVTALLGLIGWDKATNFSAFVFTVGSTIFFYLFLKSRYIPRALAGLGLFASIIALAACLIHLLRPAVPAMNVYAWSPLLLAEPATGLWLLVKSVRVPASSLFPPVPDDLAAEPRPTA